MPKPAWVQLEPQVKMLLDPNDHVSRRIAENGVWEPETWRVVEPHLQRGATLVDVGAHIGYYSLKAAGRVGPNGRVIAIEPDPDTVRKLQENIRANDARNITVQPVACAGSEAILEFFAARNNPTISSISRANASEGAISIRVRARPLDAILHDVATSRVDVLKIDVEGAELQVLKGAQETLTRYHPLLVVELIDGQLREMGTSSAEVTDFLRSYGYAVRDSGLDGMNTEFVYQTGTP